MSHASWLLLAKDTQRLLSVTCLALFIISLAVSTALSVAVLAVRVFRRSLITALNSAWLICTVDVVLSGMALLSVTVLPVVLADVWSVTCMGLMLERTVLFLWRIRHGEDGNPRSVEACRRRYILEGLIVIDLLLVSALITLLTSL